MMCNDTKSMIVDVVTILVPSDVLDGLGVSQPAAKKRGCCCTYHLYHLYGSLAKQQVPEPA